MSHILGSGLYFNRQFGVRSMVEDSAWLKTIPDTKRVIRILCKTIKAYLTQSRTILNRNNKMNLLPMQYSLYLDFDSCQKLYNLHQLVIAHSARYQTSISAPRTFNQDPEQCMFFGKTRYIWTVCVHTIIQLELPMSHACNELWFLWQIKMTFMTVSDHLDKIADISDRESKMAVYFL